MPATVRAPVAAVPAISARMSVPLPAAVRKPMEEVEPVVEDLKMKCEPSHEQVAPVRPAVIRAATALRLAAPEKFKPVMLIGPAPLMAIAKEPVVIAVKFARACCAVVSAPPTSRPLVAACAQRPTKTETGLGV